MMTSNRLPTLQAELAKLHADVQHHTAAAAEKALAAGAALVEAKALCKHGEWAGWLKATGVPERSAQRYMRLHRLGLKSAIVADLGVAEADRVAALMEKLWPDPGCGKFCIGASGRGMFSSVIWRPDSDPFAYFAGYQVGEIAEDHDIPTWGRSVNSERPMAALGIAIAHQQEFSPLRITGVFDFEGEQEAIEHFQTMQSEMTDAGLRFIGGGG
jgi:hypothetical protein